MLANILYIALDTEFSENLLTFTAGCAIMLPAEGVASALCVASQHTDRQVWLASNCETYARPTPVHRV